MLNNSTKSLHNEMLSLEKNCDMIISGDKYYAVKATLDLSDSESGIDVAKKMLQFSPEPISIYHHDEGLFILFSCVEGDQHQLDGKYCAIISKYVQLLGKEFPKKEVVCSIIQFDTRIQILTYLSWIVYQTQQNAMIKFSEGKITQKELHFMTELELISKISSWSNISDQEKYGTFLKLGTSKNGKLIIKKMSEKIDTKNDKKYKAFLFE
jgi:hypothetical protein